MAQAPPGQTSHTVVPTRGVMANPDFRRLWLGLSSSLVGTQITALAIPLIAVIELGATPFQMGLLAAAGQAPFLIVSLPAGVWVDRIRRRPLLIASDLGSAVLLVSIPIAAAADALGPVQLGLVTFGVGTFAALGEIAHYAYVPSLLGREHLVEGNSRIQISYSVAESAGPGLGGLLIQLLSAPLAIVIDSLSFVVSAVMTQRIRRPETAPVRDGPAPSFIASVTEGLQSLLNHRLLRPIILTSMADGLFTGAIVALFILFASRDLELSPILIGLIFAAGGVCAVPGAMRASWAATRFGVGPAILSGWLIEATARLAIPLVAGPTVAVVAILAASQAVVGATGTIANIHQWSLRQAVTPDHLQGRVTASHRFLVYGATAIGALLGGTLGSGLGLRRALLICAIGGIVSRMPAIWSPLRTLRVQPTEVSINGPPA